MASMANHSHFVFRSTDTIGSAGAEDDREFLKACFVDTGALGLLQKPTDNRRIILGRTGAGKSGLLAALDDAEPDRVIRISPEHLALTYVTNSTILSFFGGIGVNLDPFFKLLWRHVIAVEVLSRHFQRHPDAEDRPVLQRLRAMFLGASKHDKEMKQAVQYLDDWGQSFWQDTEYRVKEITSQFETKLDGEAKAAVGLKNALISSGVRASDAFSETETAELITRGQNVVTTAQIQDLSKILKLIDSILDDKQDRYYLVIDGLDENWVEDRARYKLIMALLQTARDFGHVRHVKVIVSIRRDLIERVFRLTRDSGFQEEKYQSLYLPLTWSRDEIIEVLDRRIGKLVASRYTKAAVTHKDLLPKEFRHKPIADYIYSIAPRPRDVISFFNTCILAAADRPALNTEKLKLAEGDYSRNRLRALADEWSADYPTLLDFATILQKRSASFKLASVTDSQIDDLCLAVASTAPGKLGLLGSAMQVVDRVMNSSEFKFALFRTFYQVGLVGLKLAPHESESWADETGKSVSPAEISDETSAVVHPAFRRSLGIREA